MATQQSCVKNGNLEGTYTKNVTTVPNKMVRLGGLGSFVVWDSFLGDAPKWGSNPFHSFSWIQSESKSPGPKPPKKQTFGLPKKSMVWGPDVLVPNFLWKASSRFPGCFLCTSLKKKNIPIPIPKKKAQVTECSAEPKCSPTYTPNYWGICLQQKTCCFFGRSGVHHLMSLLIGSGWIWAPSCRLFDGWICVEFAIPTFPPKKNRGKPIWVWPPKWGRAFC